MGKIILENLAFYAYHGVFPEEQKIGTEFLVSVTLDCDLEKASQSDDLNDTINYGLVYELIAREMSVPSKLIEHVAGRIKRSLKNKFSNISSIQVCITKKNPPVKGIGSVRVEI